MRIEGFFDGELAPKLDITAREKTFGVVIDTGFNGELMLPQKLIDELGFHYSMKSEAELADGSIIETTLYSGKIN